MNSAVEEHHITVPRTARYHTLGDPSTARALWIVLHGYGHLARYFLREFEGLEDELLIVAPEGLSRYYADREHTRVGAAWMTREDREYEVADQLTYLDRLASVVAARCAPKTPLHVLGFSQGVATACRWTALGATPVHRAVLWGGSLPPDIPDAAIQERWRDITIDLVHGEKDPVVPLEILGQSEAKLRSAGARYAIHRFDGAHALDKLLLQRLIKA